MHHLKGHCSKTGTPKDTVQHVNDSHP